MNMRNHNRDWERIYKEASSKTLNLYNRMLADAVGVSVPQCGSPSANRDALIDLVVNQMRP